MVKNVQPKKVTDEKNNEKNKVKIYCLDVVFFVLVFLVLVIVTVHYITQRLILIHYKLN